MVDVFAIIQYLLPHVVDMCLICVEYVSIFCTFEFGIYLILTYNEILEYVVMCFILTLQTFFWKKKRILR